ncbi:MAG TPA: hypothetical protein PKH31_17010, partial [Candidatus Sumerlaeota bacterium]|nr:hypothetical protein [Candidatus Sumerlaeota bacterium]
APGTDRVASTRAESPFYPGVSPYPNRTGLQPLRKWGHFPWPGAGSRFARWTGDVPVGDAGQNPLKFTIRGDTSLKAEFEAGSHPAVWMVR